MRWLRNDFTRDEFKCKCGKDCGYTAVDSELLNTLQRLRNHYDKAVIITSGNRCPNYNAQVGGASNSRHIYSLAADFRVSSIPNEDVYALLDFWFPDTHGIGIYDTWIHFDVRTEKARWDKRSSKQ